VLTIFRRHVQACPHRATGYRRCRCPISVEGTLEGREIRKALGTNSWERATEIIREWELAGVAVTPQEQPEQDFYWTA
jgi:integrase/recombinase XerD